MRKQNVGAGERTLRIVFGGALATWGALMLLDGGSAIRLLLYVSLVALGIDFVVTGVRGYCPLYYRLGWSTARPKHV